MSIVLRDYQEESVWRVLESKRKIIECAPTGSGKTIMQAFVAKHGLDMGLRTAILTPRAEIFNQTHAGLREICGARNVGTLRSGDTGNVYAPVQVISWPTLVARMRRGLEYIPDVDRVLVDECFVAGTMVGSQPIEAVRVGDFVPSFNHAKGEVEYRRVMGTSKRRAARLVTVFTTGGSFTCTPEHPVFSGGEYIRAESLYSGQEVVSIGVLHEGGDDGLRGMRDSSELPWALSKSTELSVVERSTDWPRVLLRKLQGFLYGDNEEELAPNGGHASRIIGQNEKKQPHALCENQSESFCEAKGDGLETAGSGGQWAASACASVVARFHAWVGNRSGRSDQNAKRQRLSDLLQDRCSEQAVKGRGGDKRPQSRRVSTTGAGQQEKGFLRVAWVEDIVIHESGSDRSAGELCPDGFVYNLEVEGNNNYFANGVLVHNCHLSLAPKIGKVLEYYDKEGAHIVGYSATPARKSGLGLGNFYDDITVVRTVRQLIDDGHLAPCEYWGGKQIDVAGIKTVAGDFQQKTLAERAAVLVGDVVDNWLRLAAERQTIVFAVDIGHAESLRERFLESGKAASIVHNRLPEVKRAEEVAKFKSGISQVLVNVQIASYGFDSPEVSCVVAARPTKSIVLWLQMLGRGMRPAPDKDACMVLDHADNVRRLGMAEDVYRWELSESNRRGVTNIRAEKQKELRQDTANTCEACNYIWSGSRICPACGWMIPFTKRDVETIDADLVRISGKKMKVLPKDWPDHQQFYRMLVWHARQCGFKQGWAAYRFKDKCGDWPPREWQNLAGMPTDERVRNWIKGMAIRDAKGRQKRERKAESRGSRDDRPAGNSNDLFASN